jgi:hypothetical protein
MLRLNGALRGADRRRRAASSAASEEGRNAHDGNRVRAKPVEMQHVPGYSDPDPVDT